MHHTNKGSSLRSATQLSRVCKSWTCGSLCARISVRSNQLFQCQLKMEPFQNQSRDVSALILARAAEKNRTQLEKRTVKRSYRDATLQPSILVTARLCTQGRSLFHFKNHTL